MLRRTCVVMLAGALAIGAPQAAFAEVYRYHVTDLGLGGDSAAYDISNNGQIVGTYVPAGGSERHAFLFDGTIQDLGIVGDAGRATAVNDEGEVVGYNTEGNSFRAFYYDGTRHDISFLGGDNSVYSTARDINAHGDIVGAYGSSLQSFMYRDGTFTVLNGTVSARSINDLGDITGSYKPTSGDRAFIYHDGVYQDLLPELGYSSVGLAINNSRQLAGSMDLIVPQPFLGVPQAMMYDHGSVFKLGGSQPFDSEAFGINSVGQVVGHIRSSPFLYDNGETLDLNALINPAAGWFLTDARAINDRGDIVGTGAFQGERHAFLLTLVPEPATIWTGLLGGAAAVAFARKQCRRRALGGTKPLRAQ